MESGALTPEVCTNPAMLRPLPPFAARLVLSMLFKDDGF